MNYMDNQAIVVAQMPSDTRISEHLVCLLYLHKTLY